MKTKIAIINETVEAYSDPSKRATRGRPGEDSGCFYLQEGTGNRCAVGRCLKDPEKFRHLSYVGSANERLLSSGSSLENELMEEYRGHDIAFWADLQRLHDRGRHFTNDGYSAEGLKYIKELKIKYAGQ